MRARAPVAQTMQWLVLLLIVAVTANGSEHWVIQLEPGSDPAIFAARHNVTYIGQTPLANHYSFIGNDMSSSLARARGSAGIRWMELQVARRQYTRTRDPLWHNSWHLQQWEGDVGLDAESVWNETTGRGVTIAIVDDGLQWTHPDLTAQWSRADSWNFNGGDASNPNPSRGDGHGTSCAGVCCAVRDNAICGAGVCPDCKVAGLRTIAEAVNDVTEATALAFRAQHIDVYSCSWGPYDDGNRLEGPGYVLQQTLEQQTRVGRNGKGSIYVWAAGNGAHYQDNCNYDGYANSRFTIAVGALTNAGTRAYYSEPCSALFVVAPSSGGTRSISTVDLVGSDGYDRGSCTDTFGGTSSAAPLAAGVVALLLHVRPDLTWRDVQHVLASGATLVDAGHYTWTRSNVRGYRHSEHYGFGNVVLPRLVTAAKAHTLVSPASILCDTGPVSVYESLPSTVTLACPQQLASSFVEHVELVVGWQHDCRGQVTLALTSGHATSQLAALRRDCASGNTTWTFRSVRHWGEYVSPSWTLLAADALPADAHSGTLQHVRLIVYGINLPV